MNSPSYLQSFVEITLLQYVPGAQFASRLPVVVPAEPICELDPSDVEDDLDDDAANDDALADSARSIYLEQ